MRKLQVDLEQELVWVLYNFELQRARYLLQCYYRTRIKKIEKHVLYILQHTVRLCRGPTAVL